MSNSLNQEKQFNVTRDEVIRFLMKHGYVGNISMEKLHAEIKLIHESGQGFVVVPNYKSLTVPQIEDVLKRAKIPFSEFEEYLEHLIRVREGDAIIKSCIDSPPIK